MKKIKYFLYILLFSLVLFSCRSSVLYKTPVDKIYKKQLKKGTYTYSSDTSLYEHRVQVDDRLSIKFLNDFEDINKPENNTISEPPTYLVDKLGNIRIPMLGKVFVKGKTAGEIADLLEKEFKKFEKSPNIVVEIVNLEVFLQGEVKKPGKYQLTKERTHITEIIAEAGGITPNGKSEFVKIIRGGLIHPKVIYLDMTKIQGLKSNDLYLRKGDVIYIEPRGITIASNKIRPYTAFTSIITTLVTVTLLVNQISK